jgi:hypothetical protein
MGWRGAGVSVKFGAMPLSEAVEEKSEVRIMRVFLTPMPSINLRAPA